MEGYQILWYESVLLLQQSLHILYNFAVTENILLLLAIMSIRFNFFKSMLTMCFIHFFLFLKLQKSLSSIYILKFSAFLSKTTS